MVPTRKLCSSIVLARQPYCTHSAVQLHSRSSSTTPTHDHSAALLHPFSSSAKTLQPDRTHPAAQLHPPRLVHLLSQGLEPEMAFNRKLCGSTALTYQLNCTHSGRFISLRKAHPPRHCQSVGFCASAISSLSLSSPLSLHTHSPKTPPRHCQSVGFWASALSSLSLSSPLSLHVGC